MASFLIRSREMPYKYTLEKNLGSMIRSESRKSYRISRSLWLGEDLFSSVLRPNFGRFDLLTYRPIPEGSSFVSSRTWLTIVCDGPHFIGRMRNPRKWILLPSAYISNISISVDCSHRVKHRQYYFKNYHEERNECDFFYEKRMFRVDEAEIFARTYSSTTLGFTESPWFRNPYQSLAAHKTRVEEKGRRNAPRLSPLE